MYQVLVVDRGWPPQHYQRWLTAILVDQLLAPSDIGAEMRNSLEQR
jgi:hypothetical protein